MAWNKSEKPVSQVCSRKPSFNAKALVAGFVVVLGAGVTCFLLMAPNQGRKRHPEQGKRVVSEAKPVVTPKADAKPVVAKKEAKPQRIGEVRDGKLLMPDGTLHVVCGEVTNGNDRTKSPYAIFDFSSENQIAGLLMTKPGEMLYGNPNYNGRFTKNFLRSLKVPIVVKEDDPPETKELKRAVTQAKIELKEAYDRGEDIEKIMLDSRAELQRLARVKNQLVLDGMRMAMKDAQTPEDVDDYMQAMNKVLKDKGIAPLEASPLTKIKIDLLRKNLSKEKETDK